jgi:hypothetical protein
MTSFQPSLANPEDRRPIYAVRDEVYARELGQHSVNAEQMLSDVLHDFNEYIE